MRKELGIILMEEVDGTVAVQFFADSNKAGESFDNTKGTLGQAPQRMTFIALQYTADGQLRTSTVTSKDLPVPEVPLEERPDAWRLGEGPVKIKKEG